jgi:hypothetical protein
VDKAKLSDLFVLSDGAPIERAGDLVHLMYDVPVEPNQRITCTFLEASILRPQGLRAKVINGNLLLGSRVYDNVLDSRVYDNVVFWSDTAPSVVRFEVLPGGDADALTLRLWNAWRDTGDVFQAWIGNAGIVVEDHGQSLTLHCSDGWNGPNFHDLVVRVDR